MRITFKPIKEVLKDVRSGKLLQKNLSEFMKSLPDNKACISNSDARSVGMSEKISSKHHNRFGHYGIDKSGFENKE